MNINTSSNIHIKMLSKMPEVPKERDCVYDNSYMKVYDGKKWRAVIFDPKGREIRILRKLVKRYQRIIKEGKK